MNSLVKLIIYFALGTLIIFLVIGLLPLLLVFWIIMMLLDAFFGIKMIKFNKLRHFNGSRGKPRPEPSPRETPFQPHVPASEDVIDVEAVDLPDEPVGEESRIK